MSPLCFQPGIGWQPVPEPVFGDTGKLGAPHIAGRGAPAGPVASGFATGGSSRLLNAQSSRGTHRRSSACPGPPMNATAIEAIVGNVPANNQINGVAATPLVDMNGGAQYRLQTNPAPTPANRFAFQPSTMGGSSAPVGGNQSSAGTRPGTSADQVGSLANHAYVSPIKLRRMIRNAPDLQTRMRLREMQKNLAEKSRIPAANQPGNNPMGKNTTGNRAMKEQLKNQQGRKIHPLTVSGGHDRVSDSTKERQHR